MDLEISKIVYIIISEASSTNKKNWLLLASSGIPVILFRFICAITPKVLGSRVLGSDVLEVKSQAQI